MEEMDASGWNSVKAGPYAQHVNYGLGRLLTVVYTNRLDLIRLISARRERESYEGRRD